MAFLRFEDLRVFQLAEKLADEIWDIVSDWEYCAIDRVGKLLVKSADSIGANIAEGSGRGTPKDNKRFIRISRGSYNEMKYWLRRASRRNLITEAQTKYIKEMVDELGPSLNAFLKSIGDA